MERHLKLQLYSKLILLFIILSGLCSTFRLFNLTLRLPRIPGEDEITLYEKRFEELKKILPPHGVVGYITDKEIKFDPPFSNEDVQMHRNYDLTQYALAPVIVDKTPNHELVIGNFDVPDTNPESFLDRGFIVDHNFGNGVILFKKRP